MPLEQRIEIVKKAPEAYAKLFLGDRTEGSGIQYILLLMGDFLGSTFDLYTNVQWNEEFVTDSVSYRYI